VFSVWDSHRHNPVGRIAHEVTGSFFPPIRLSSRRAVLISIDPIKDSMIDASLSNINAVVVKLQRRSPTWGLARGVVYGSPIIDQSASVAALRRNKLSMQSCGNIVMSLERSAVSTQRTFSAEKI
jgi:hypothetical protein